jgi:putative FmdB family regulatory protein
MPIYEYKCGSCGTKFEKIEKFSDSPLETHEGCGGPVERLLSTSALQFKGTGWYVTDYAKSNGSGGPKNDSKSDSKGDSKSESKSDSKSESSSPEAKSDSSSSSGKNSDSNSNSNSSSTSSAATSSDNKK